MNNTIGNQGTARTSSQARRGRYGRVFTMVRWVLLGLWAGWLINVFFATDGRVYAFWLLAGSGLGLLSWLVTANYQAQSHEPEQRQKGQGLVTTESDSDALPDISLGMVLDYADDEVSPLTAQQARVWLDHLLVVQQGEGDQVEEHKKQ